MALPLIAQDIIAITARPDRIPEMNTAIRQAVQIAHKSEDYPKDLIEIRLQSDAVAFDMQATLDINVRKISHIVPEYLNVDGSFTRGTSLKFTEPRAIYDRTVPDINSGSYYIAGQTLNIRMKNPTGYFQFGYWKYPDVTEAGINSDWIVLNYPEVIINLGAAFVFKALLNDASFNTYYQLGISYLNQMKNDVLYLGDVADVYSGVDSWEGQ